MYTGTTNLIAAAREKDRGNVDQPRTSRTFIAALQLSGFVGAGLGTVLFGLAVPILRTIIGNDAIDPEVFSAALKYVRIRALGMPAAAIIGSSQAASLGMQDIKSPLYILLAAAVINFFGDVTFVGNPHPWIGGSAGAAWATVFSQYAAVVLFVQWMCHAPRQTSIAEEKVSTRGFLEGKFRGRYFFRLPSREKVADFTPYVLPVTSTQIGRVSSYIAMSHVISSSLGTVSMAAQQVIISFWNCLYPVGESLSLTAQSFVPSIFEKKVSKARADALRQTLLNFWKAGVVLGTGLFGAVICIPLVHRCFTTDPAVMTAVDTIVPFLLAIFSTLGIFTSSEGVLLGQRDLGFLGKSYTSFFFIVPYLMLRVKRSVQLGTAHSLRSVWVVFTAYQLFRTVLWILRAMQLQRRAYRRASERPEK
jgi:Na+-driven multidrug efflux pump